MECGHRYRDRRDVVISAVRPRNLGATMMRGIALVVDRIGGRGAGGGGVARSLLNARMGRVEGS